MTASTTTTPTKTTPSTFVTRSAAFKRLAKWAFEVCDDDSTGKITQSELYAGILLVHVNLAKYAGAAACYPPTREVCDQLFIAADADQSGTIDEAEFLEIVQICSVDIAGRIVVYYGILILLVPYVADVAVLILFQMDDLMGWELKLLHENSMLQMVESFISWKELTDRCVSMALFFLVIPMLFDAIDRYSKSRAKKTKSP